MVPRMQLLLVEDDPTMQTTLQRALTRRGMEVTAVGDGKAALSQWVGRVPDAVVLDLTLPGKDGLLHISQIAHERVEKVSDYLAEGQIVKVKVMETDEKGRIKLSMKALAERPAGGGDRPAPAERGEREPRQSREGGRQSADQQQQQQQ